MGYSADECILEMEEHFRHNEILKAWASVEQALDMEPGSALAHYYAGTFNRYRFKNLEQAKFHYELAIKFDPTLKDAYTEIIELCEEYSDIKTMERILKQGVENHCILKFEVYRSIARLYEQNGEFKKSLEAYDSSLKFCSEQYNMDEIKEDITRIKEKIVIPCAPVPPSSMRAERPLPPPTWRSKLNKVLSVLL
jgi:tetratricopeptide (TPR) repeat protein